MDLIMMLLVLLVNSTLFCVPFVANCDLALSTPSQHAGALGEGVRNAR